MQPDRNVSLTYAVRICYGHPGMNYINNLSANILYRSKYTESVIHYVRHSLRPQGTTVDNHYSWNLCLYNWLGTAIAHTDRIV